MFGTPIYIIVDGDEWMENGLFTAWIHQRALKLDDGVIATWTDITQKMITPSEGNTSIQL
jgi:hypothetical protein